MKKFLTGNVIKTKYGHIEIVTDAKEDYIKTVFFDVTSASAGHRLKDYDIKKRCYCNEGHGDDPSCECKGTGEYTQTIYGFEHAELLASNVKEYILDRLTKNFDF